MASIEEYVELLLPMQQETIARAALRGITWERIVMQESVWSPDASRAGKGHYHVEGRTKYAGYLPGDAWFGNFDDVYECAVHGLTLLESADAPRQEALGPDAPFALAPGNEQPTQDRRTFRWPVPFAFNYRGGK